MAAEDELTDWELTHQGYISLIFAIESNNKTEVETLISQGALAEPLEFRYETPLQLAIKKNNIDIVDILNSNGADFDQETKHGKPFHYAASLGFTDHLKYFLDKGFDVNTKNRFGDTALHEICKKENLEDATTCAFLLDHGADVKAVNFQKKNPLYYVSRQLNHKLHTTLRENWRPNFSDFTELKSALNFFSVFLNHGINLDKTLLKYPSLLISAVVTGNEKLVEYLCERYPEIDSSFSFERLIRNRATPVHWAVHMNNLNIIKILVNNGARIISSDFHLAVEKEFPDIVTFFLEKGVDVNEKSKDGDSPLHLICRTDPSDTSEAVCKILLKHGALLEALNGDDETPLHLAVSKKNLPIVSNLVDKGADLYHETRRGQPFHVAFSDNFEPNIANYFLEKGVNVDVTNMFGQTALHFICNDPRTKNPEACAFLLNHGADVNAVDDSNKTPVFYVLKNLHFILQLPLYEGGDWRTDLTYFEKLPELNFTRLLLSHGANLDDALNECPMVLHGAAAAGYVELAELLLEMNVDIDARGKDGATALHRAAFFERYEMICALLRRGASIDAVMSGNLTALHIAVFQKDLKSALALMNFGADINARNSCGISPIDIVKINEDTSMSIALLLRGVDFYAEVFASDTIIDLAIFNSYMDHNFVNDYVMKRDFFPNNNPETILDAIHLCLRLQEKRERILYLNNDELSSIVETEPNTADAELAKEVMLLRITDICVGLTLYELLTESVRDIAAFLLHEDLPIPDLTMFKYYGYYFPLQRRIIDVEGYNLRKRAGYELSECWKVRIPEEITDKIINFLNKRDMLNILRAVGYKIDHINHYEKKMEELEREFCSIFERREDDEDVEDDESVDENDEDVDEDDD